MEPVGGFARFPRNLRRAAAIVAELEQIIHHNGPDAKRQAPSRVAMVGRHRTGVDHDQRQRPTP
jgi:hypothetical protein